MKALVFVLMLALISPIFSAVAYAYTSVESPQNPPAPPAPPAPPSPPPQRPELGKWWKNSTVVRELGLSGTQIKEIEQTFLNHRLNLIDLRAALEREEVQLQPLMESDKPDDAKVNAQLDRVLAARNKLEKENTMMMLAIRRILTLEQWKKLQELQERRTAPPRPPAPPAPPSIPPPPAPPAPPAPPKPPAEGEVYVVGGGVRVPVAEYQPLPPYTQEARDAKVEGIVLLQCIIRKDGSITDVRVVRGLGYGLDESATNTVTSLWRFKPGTLNETPVDVRANVEISFRLYDKP
jgi:TonB family protein